MEASFSEHKANSGGPKSVNCSRVNACKFESQSVGRSKVRMFSSGSRKKREEERGHVLVLDSCSRDIQVTRLVGATAIGRRNFWSLQLRFVTVMLGKLLRTQSRKFPRDVARG